MADETSGMGENIDVEEPDCTDASVDLELPEEERRIGEEQEDAEGPDAIPDDELAPLDEAADMEDDEAAEDALARAFGEASFRAAGGWCGTERHVNRMIRVARRRGLSVTSTKRDWGGTGSDHHRSQKCSFAADLSNVGDGQQPSPEMDRTARRIAALLGVRGWRGGNLRLNRGGYRWQILFRTQIGGDHFDHIHVGVRRL